MKNHLKSAGERFDKLSDQEFKISPISTIDGEIITEIVEYLKKVGEVNLVHAIEQWKYLKDEEVRDIILEMNTNFHQEEGGLDILENMLGGKKGKGSFVREFIRFRGVRIDTYFITSILKEEGFNKNREYEFRIVINKDLPEQAPVKNIEFCFNTDEEREAALEELDEILEGKNIKFL